MVYKLFTLLVKSILKKFKIKSIPYYILYIIIIKKYIILILIQFHQYLYLFNLFFFYKDFLKILKTKKKITTNTLYDTNDMVEHMKYLIVCKYNYIISYF